MNTIGTVVVACCIAFTPGPSGGKNDVWRKAKKLRAELLRRLEARDAPPFIDRKIAPETQPNFSSSCLADAVRA
jgi:hypothetical protein